MQDAAAYVFLTFYAHIKFGGKQTGITSVLFHGVYGVYNIDMWIDCVCVHRCVRRFHAEELLYSTEC